MKKMLLTMLMLIAMTVVVSANSAYSDGNYTFNSFSINEAKIQQLYVKPQIHTQGVEAVVVNCREWITLRGEPSVYSEDMGHIPLGAYVTYYGPANSEFCIIGYNGMLGYAMSYYIHRTGIEY